MICPHYYHAPPHIMPHECPVEPHVYPSSPHYVFIPSHSSSGSVSVDSTPLTDGERKVCGIVTFSLLVGLVVFIFAYLVLRTDE